MRMFLSLALGAALGTVWLASPVRAADELTGKMQPFSYLLGAAWNCTTAVPAMGSRPAHSDQGTATFEVGPGNVVHNHILTPDYIGDVYYGYNDKTASYWSTSADGAGGYGYLSSSDGKSYTGTASMGTVTMQDATTYAKVGDSKITVHEVVSGGAEPATTFDTTCSR